MLILCSISHHGQFAAGQSVLEEPVAEVLGKVDEFADGQLALVVAWAFHVDGDVFIADFWGELGVVDFSVFNTCAPILEVLKLFAHLLLIIVLAIKLLALILGTLLPTVHVEAVSEHQEELYNV